MRNVTLRVKRYDPETKETKLQDYSFEVEEHFTLGSPDVHQQRIGELLAAETA